MHNIDGFPVQRRLGSGAFGDVYLAHDPVLDRPLAIKVLKGQTDGEDFQRFLQEARTVGNLNHPNIVTVYASKPWENTFYLAMEYLPGGNLRTLMQRQGRLSLEQVARIGIHICEGLAAVHAKDIVHRDIKPENILLTEDGRTKIADFGIAHVPMSNLTMTGFQPGTMIYMSPEQVLGQALDGRSDVYTVGAVLYELLTGQHYFDVEAVHQRARQAAGNSIPRFQRYVHEFLEIAICESAPSSLRQHRPDTPSWLAEAVTGALSKSRHQRPTATQLSQTLERNGSGTTTKYAGMGESGHDSALRQHWTRGKGYAEQGKWEEAVKEFEAIVRVNSNDADALAWLGWSNTCLQRWERAIENYRSALHFQPRDPWLHARLGWAYAQMGQFGSAMSLLQSAIRLNAQNHDAHYMLGYVYEVQENLDDAARELHMAVQLKPNDTLTNLALGRVYAAKAVELTLATGESKPWSIATSWLITAIHLDQRNANAHFLLGVAYGMLRQDHRAIPELELAVQLEPHYTDAHHALAWLYNRTGRLQDSDRLFRHAAEMAPGWTPLYCLLGRMYRERGDEFKATRYLKTAVQLGAHNALTYVELGRAYTEQGHWQGAEDTLKRALQLSPNDAEVHFLLGSVLQRKGHLDEAEYELGEALRLNPTLPKARTHLEALRLESDRRAEDDSVLASYADFYDDEWLDNSEMDNPPSTSRPDEGTTDAAGAAECCRYGLAHVRAGRLNDAIREYNRALKLAPNDVYIWCLLAEAYFNKGDWHFAMQLLRSVLIHAPDHAWAHCLMGDIYAKQDRWAEAEAEYNAALSINPDYQEAQRGLAGKART